MFLRIYFYVSWESDSAKVSYGRKHGSDKSGRVGQVLVRTCSGCQFCSSIKYLPDMAKIFSLKYSFFFLLFDFIEI